MGSTYRARVIIHPFAGPRDGEGDPAVDFGDAGKVRTGSSSPDSFSSGPTKSILPTEDARSNICGGMPIGDMVAVPTHAEGGELVKRIDRLLLAVNRQGRELNRLESHHLLDALSYLAEGRWALCDQAIGAAECGFAAAREDLLSVPASIDPVDTARLRDRLNAISAMRGLATA
jgi:hypothetical protein